MQKFTGKAYLQMDIASSFGKDMDKQTWATRLAWFDANESRLRELIPQAENPAMFFAGIEAWECFKAGKASGYPISLDATSSGLQLLAVLTGDRKAAMLCNVINAVDHTGTVKRKDAYTAIYSAMLEVIKDNSKISRDDTKDAIMTSLYSSVAIPKQIFGEGPLLNVFYDTMKANCPGVWELNEAMLAFWRPDALSHDWVLPDNFHVKVKVMTQEKETVHFLNEPFDVLRKVNKPMPEGRSLGANTVHSLDGMIVREMTRRCDYNPEQVNYVYGLVYDHTLTQEDVEEEDENYRMTKKLWSHYKESGYLSMRIIDYLDPFSMTLVDKDAIADLLNSLPDKPFKVMSVHDCFRCLPNYANDLRMQYNRQLWLIARSSILEWILSQLVGRPISIQKLDTKLDQQILDAEYSLS